MGVHYTTHSGVGLKCFLIKRYLHSFYVLPYSGEVLPAPLCGPGAQPLSRSRAHRTVVSLTSQHPCPSHSGISDCRATRHSSGCPLPVLRSVLTSLPGKKTTSHLGSAQELPPVGSWPTSLLAFPLTELTTAPCSPHSPGSLGHRP